MAKLLFSNFSF